MKFRCLLVVAIGLIVGLGAANAIAATTTLTFSGIGTGYDTYGPVSVAITFNPNTLSTVQVDAQATYYGLGAGSTTTITGPNSTFTYTNVPGNTVYNPNDLGSYIVVGKVYYGSPQSYGYNINFYTVSTGTYPTIYYPQYSYYAYVSSAPTYLSTAIPNLAVPVSGSENLGIMPYETELGQPNIYWSDYTPGVGIPGGDSMDTVSINTATLSGTAAPPQLYLLGSKSGSSLSGGNTNLNLSLVVANSPPPNSTLIPGVSLPAGTSTLQQAAAALHYQGFEWVQTVTSIPDPSPFYECNGVLCTSSTQLTSLSAPFLDPPLNGYTYCESTCGSSYPFYYSLSNVLSNPTLCIEMNGSHCVETLEPNSATLNFFDAPSDPCIVGANGAPSVAWTTTVGLLCGGQTSKTNSPIKFTTQLVGILPGYQAGQTGNCITLKECVVLATANWSDNFNGWSIFPGVGGIATTYSDMQVDPTSGSGGVTSLSLSAGVPEPPSSILLAIALAGVFALHTARGGPAGWFSKSSRDGRKNEELSTTGV